MPVISGIYFKSSFADSSPEVLPFLLLPCITPLKFRNLEEGVRVLLIEGVQLGSHVKRLLALEGSGKENCPSGLILGNLPGA
jgi:hypothetical protein